MGYKYIVVIKDSHGRFIESVGTNNKYYAKWVCDVETREQGHICEVFHYLMSLRKIMLYYKSCQ